MNRIILIGNGFDLAHGLPTRYEDFINSYWKGIVENLYGIVKARDYFSYVDSYEDDFISIKVSDYAVLGLKELQGKIQNECVSYKKLKEDILDVLLLDGNSGIDMKKELSVVFKNMFFQRISESSCKNWVDIENEYYRSLCECLEKRNRKEDRLNKELLDVKSHLM